MVHQLVIFASLVFFWTLESITKDTLRSRPGFLRIFKGFWCPWLSFGMLCASTLPSLGTLGRSWDDLGTLGSTRKDIVRSRLVFYRFLFDLGGPFREIFGYNWSEKHGLFISISRLFFLMIFAFESGCLGLKNQAFCKGGIEKINFRSNWISHDSRIHFS